MDREWIDISLLAVDKYLGLLLLILFVVSVNVDKGIVVVVDDDDDVDDVEDDGKIIPSSQRIRCAMAVIRGKKIKT